MVAFSGSEAKCQALGVESVQGLPIEASMNFQEAKTRRDSVCYIVLDLLCDFPFHLLISFKPWHISQGLLLVGHRAF